MFRKILVAMDSSLSGKRAFDEALALAKVTNSCLMLLHVLSNSEESSPDIHILSRMNYSHSIDNKALKRYMKEWEAFKERSLDLLRERVAEAEDAGVSAEYTQQVGSPAWTICNLAHTWSADIIVIGCGRDSELGDEKLGSVTNYVIHNAHCSVLTVNCPVKSNNTKVSQAKQLALVH